MSGSFARHIEEDARLVMLKELASQLNGRLNETILASVLEAFGHTRSKDWIRTQLRKMQELGAIVLQEVGEGERTLLVAQITRAGEDHLLLRSQIEGIKLPSRGA